MFIRMLLNEGSRFCMDDNNGQNGGNGGDQGGNQQQQNNQQQNQNNNQQQAPVAWYPNATAEDVAYLQSKGWDKAEKPAEAILTSYKNLEKLFGADKAGNTVILPGAEADKAALDAFYNKLGRPEAPDKYTAEAFAGLDEEGNKSLRAAAHAAGITDKQLAAMQKFNNESEEAFKNQLVQNATIEFEAQKTALVKEWGAAHDQNIQLAKEGVAKLGWTKDQIDAMQIGLGYDGVMKLALQIGKAVGEGTFVTNDGNRASGGNPNALSPAQATAELKRLSNDKEFTTALMDKNHPKHKEMMDRKAQLSAWVVAGQAK